MDPVRVSSVAIGPLFVLFRTHCNHTLYQYISRDVCAEYSMNFESILECLEDKEA